MRRKMDIIEFLFPSFSPCAVWNMRLAGYNRESTSHVHRDKGVTWRAANWNMGENMKNTEYKSTTTKKLNLPLVTYMKKSRPKRSKRIPQIKWSQIVSLITLGILTPVVWLLTLCLGIYFFATGSGFSGVLVYFAALLQFNAMRGWNVIIKHEEK